MYGQESNASHQGRGHRFNPLRFARLVVRRLTSTVKNNVIFTQKLGHVRIIARIWVLNGTLSIT